MRIRKDVKGVVLAPNPHDGYAYLPLRAGDEVPEGVTVHPSLLERFEWQGWVFPEPESAPVETVEVEVPVEDEVIITPEATKTEVEPGAPVQPNKPSRRRRGE